MNWKNFTSVYCICNCDEFEYMFDNQWVFSRYFHGEDPAYFFSGWWLWSELITPMLSNVFMFPMIQTRYLFLKVLVISRTIFLVISGECIYVSPESWSEHTRCRTPYFGDLQMLTTSLKSCYITRITLQGFSYSNWFVFDGNLINFRYC